MRKNFPHLRLCFSQYRNILEQWYPRDMVIMVENIHKVSEEVTSETVEVEELVTGGKGKKPRREVDRVDDEAQCYAFSGKDEAQASDVLITGTILVCDRMNNVLFNMVPLILMCLWDLPLHFICCVMSLIPLSLFLP